MIFEGWCVGFRALSDAEAEAKWTAAKAEFASQGPAYAGQLGKLELASVAFVNASLRAYDGLTACFGAFMQM